MSKQTLVLGGPGAGKTTRLLSIMEEALDNGTPPERVAFVAFTRAAAKEATDRACARFGLQPEELPYFRTLHSMCFKELGLTRLDVVTEEHLAELGRGIGELYDPREKFSVGEEGPGAKGGGKRNADPLLTIDHYARTTKQTLQDAHRDHGGSIEWRRLERFSEAYRIYKEERDLVDFTDMLTTFSQSGSPVPVDVAIIDEAQDLTPAQWSVTDRGFSEATEVWAAGDDDQAIHKWAGGAEERFLSLAWPREVLPLSHRLPKVIFDFAQEVVRRIGRRFEKDYAPSRTGGEVNWVRDPSEVDLSGGKWLLLARTKAQLARLEAVAREQAVTYSCKGVSAIDRKEVRAIIAYEALRAGKRVEGADAAIAMLMAGFPYRDIDESRTYTAVELKFDARVIWHDALIRMPLDDREYYLAALRRGEKLTDPPRVRIDTIHGAKGLEAENVVLVTDLTYRTNQSYRTDPDSEHRVFYVGLTRASKVLFLVSPQTSYGFKL